MTEKIPFSKEIADTMIAGSLLHVEFCKLWSKQKNRKKEFLTLKELEQIHKIIRAKYYNDQVELLEVVK